VIFWGYSLKKKKKKKKRGEKKSHKVLKGIWNDWFSLWCLTSLSTIFQLYRGCVLLVEETGVPEENHRPITIH